MRTSALSSPLFAAALFTAALVAPAAHGEPPAAPVTSPGLVSSHPLDPQTPGPVGPVAAAPTAPPPETDWRRLRFTAGVSLTALGLVTVVLGSVLGVRAIVSKDHIGAHCSAAGKCDLTGWTYLAEAQDFSSTSTACFILGPLAMAVGGGLLISSRPWKPGATAWIRPTLGGVAAGARW